MLGRLGRHTFDLEISTHVRTHTYTCRDLRDTKAHKLTQRMLLPNRLDTISQGHKANEGSLNRPSGVARRSRMMSEREGGDLSPITPGYISTSLCWQSRELPVRWLCYVPDQTVAAWLSSHQVSGCFTALRSLRLPCAGADIPPFPPGHGAASSGHRVVRSGALDVLPHRVPLHGGVAGYIHTGLLSFKVSVWFGAKQGFKSSRHLPKVSA